MTLCSPHTGRFKTLIWLQDVEDRPRGRSQGSSERRGAPAHLRASLAGGAERGVLSFGGGEPSGTHFLPDKKKNRHLLVRSPLLEGTFVTLGNSLLANRKG